MAQIAMIPSVGDTIQQSTEDRVDAVVKDILCQEALEDGFFDLMTHTPETAKWKKDHSLENLKQLWTSLHPDTYDSAMKCYVSWIYKQRNSSRAQTLFDLLEYLVRDNSVSAKLICETILNSEHLDYNRGTVWCETFDLIQKILGGVDYKGCRDLLRLILDKCQLIPQSENISSLAQIDSVINVVAYILDRNACLLPSYFAVNEITKVCSDDKSWLHWKMGTLLSKFVQGFRPTAQMVSIIGRSHLMPIVGHSLSTGNVWRLNQSTLKFTLNGPLPYNKELLGAQTGLLRYVLEQPYSREMICNMLGLNKQAKQRCPVLEDQLVDLVVLAMERSEDADPSDDDSQLLSVWQHLSSQLIFFVLFQLASFPHMVLSLYYKLKGKNLKKGRSHLMWILLQFISGSIQKNPLADFLPVLKLYDLLYCDMEKVPLPDVNKSISTHEMAVTCIWIHLNKKAQSDKVRLQRPIPTALNDHMEFLKQNKTLTKNDYRIALLCNAYSTNTDIFSVPMSILVETINGNSKSKTSLPGGLEASAPTQPLSLSLLDSLTVHAKMSLIHHIVTKVIRLASNRGSVALAPALVETYSRLLVYIEIESLGIKGFISQLLPNVFKSQAWGILHTLLEMFSYRLHHIQPHYRVQLLSHLHSLASVPHTNHNQLHLCVESTALRLITGLGSSEVQPQLSRTFNESKSPTFFSQESEELNRALVLTLARAMHVTGSETFTSNWCKDILMNIMQNTPHNWSSHTLQCFPPSLAEFFQKNGAPKEDRSQLKRNVEIEYKKWKTMANENDIIAHFSMQGTSPLFLCILWKSLIEDNRITPTAYKVLDRLGPRLLSLHLRTFADYLVQEFSSSAATQLVNKLIAGLNDLVWKCNVVTIDRLILCLALRNLEGNEAQVSFFIIHHLLIRPPDFKMRLTDFIRENSPEHWLQTNWHEKHMAFHRKYPENFYYEASQDANNPNQHSYLPVYFGNICLRFLPVLDIVIHRLLELPPVGKSLENILDHLGGLYKFHDRPITYLYNTLHYYDRKLSSNPLLKRKLVQSITGALKDIRPANWCLSEDYQKYLTEPAEENSWIPSSEYFVKLIGRLVDTLSGKSPPPFPNCDWRFNEFPNPPAHALYATCVELMALPVDSQSVGGALLDVVMKCGTQLPRDRIMSWMNAVGLVLTSLPDTYWQVLNERVLEVIQSPVFLQPTLNINPFQLFDFSYCQSVFAEMHPSYMLALCHSVWHHASIGQLTLIPKFMEQKLKPVIQTEEQFLYLCHLVGPFLQRFHAERTRCLLELTVELYEILERIDKTCPHLHYIDPITDFLYHIKYIFVGDGVKNEVSKVIMNLRPALKYRLRFISHINVDEPLST